MSEEERPIPLWAHDAARPYLERAEGLDVLNMPREEFLEALRELLARSAVAGYGVCVEEGRVRDEARREYHEAYFARITLSDTGVQLLALSEAVEAMIDASLAEDMGALHEGFSALASHAGELREILVETLRDHFDDGALPRDYDEDDLSEVEAAPVDDPRDAAVDELRREAARLAPEPVAPVEASPAPLAPVFREPDPEPEPVVEPAPPSPSTSSAPAEPAPVERTAEVERDELDEVVPFVASLPEVGEDAGEGEGKRRKVRKRKGAS